RRSGVGNRSTAEVGGATQLAKIIQAPGPNGAVGLEGQAKAGAGCHLHPVVGGAHLHRAGAAGGSANAELAARVVAPGPEGAIGPHGQPKVAA
nr:hypothetical protein [Tanacetum cinerariifolium]